MNNVTDHVIHEQLLVAASADNPRSGEGSATLLKNGEILIIYGDFHDKDDAADAELVCRRSRDRGQTWTAPEIIQRKGPDGLNVMSVSLLRLRNDDLAFVFMEKVSKEDARPQIRLSSSEGADWGEQRVLTDVLGYYVHNNDRLVQTSSGRVLLPCAYSSCSKTCGGPECGILYSDDDGETWNRGGEWIRIQRENVTPPPSTDDNSKKIWDEVWNGEHGIVCQEPGVVELKDGSIMMWARTNSGYMYKAVSRDGGDSWGPFTAATDLICPMSPQSIKRVPGTDRLICVYNDHSTIPYGSVRWHWRTPNNLAVSDDEGESWRRVGELEPDDHNYCYTSILFLDDAAFFSYYESENEIIDGEEKRRNLASLKIKLVSLDLFK